MSTLEDFGYREQLSRALTNRDLVVYGMILMVPIAPYSVFGFVWNDAKGMVPLAYLCSTSYRKSQSTSRSEENSALLEYNPRKVKRHRPVRRVDDFTDAQVAADAA